MKKNVLITGANGQLGYSLTLGLSDSFNIIPTAKRNFDNIIKCDITNKKDLKNIFNRYNPDIIINCAGYTNHSNKKQFMNDVFKIEPKHLRNIFDVNTFGLIYGCIVFGEDMVKNKRGNIVNISSMYGIQSPRHHIYKGTNIKSPLPYAASKSSVISITKYLGTLWGKAGVRVNCISPGGIQDETHKKKWLKRYGANNPIGRMANNSEMMNAVIYLISDGSSYSNASNVVVDGGWTAW